MFAAPVPSQDGSRELSCLIEGESVVFLVEASCHTQIKKLKEFIQQRADILKNVHLDLLELWKVDIDFETQNKHSLSRLKLESLQGVQELVPWKFVEEYWSNQPPTAHVHIIVKVQATGGQKANITTALDIEEIDKLIDKELESLRGVVETFLKNPEPSIWVPPDYVTPNNREFLTNLRIPAYDNGNPSLLFHDLNVRDDKEIEKIFACETRLCICNPSGSGKTRRAFEALTKYWGFYLVAVRDVNGVGIQDLPDALAEVNVDVEWMHDLRLLPPIQRTRQNQLNRMIASHHLHKVLAARIVVFRLFLELAILVDGSLQEKYKRIWLLFQLSNGLGGALHPFVRIIRNCLPRASYDALDILVGRLDDIRGNCLPEVRFIIGLDEAHRAAGLYPYSFVSRTNNRVFRSIIREMVTVFTKSSIKLVVLGTDLSLDDLTDDMATGVGTFCGVDRCHRLGMFDTWPKLKSFLERYIPASILESHSGYSRHSRNPYLR